MKTLVLQLARLGDIYQTWPVLRALKKQAAPGDEIHLMTREIFKGAVDGLGEIDRLWHLDTRAILAPVITDRPEINETLERLDALVEVVRAEQFDRVINLSFSPFSSRFVAAIATSEAQILGYTRHADDFLAIPDDASAYFFAQVGPGRFNRVHLTDLFAHVAGVELVDDDWIKPPKFKSVECSDEVKAVLLADQKPIIVHLGASQEAKTYGTHKWMQVVRGLIDKAGVPVVLIGSQSERGLADAVRTSSAGLSAIDLVGKTTLQDLFGLIKKAHFVIGGDSAPMHIAALTGTPVLNLSFSSVRLWETGPKSPGSRILAFQTPNDLASDVVVTEALSMLRHEPGDKRCVRVTSRLEPYQIDRSVDTDRSEWEWVQAIYMGQPFPVPRNALVQQALLRLFEVNELAIEQLAVIERGKDTQTALSILERFDEIIEVISGMVSEAGILVRWFQTERVRLGPMESEALIGRTKALHFRLRDVLSLYVNIEAAGSGDVKNRGGNVSDDVNLG